MNTKTTIPLELKPSIKEINNLVKNFQDSIIFNNEVEPITDILSIIERPFIDRADNDLLSVYFHKFYKSCDIPVGLPVFAILTLISAWCMFNKANLRIPLARKPKPLNLWIMCLASTGSGKTLAWDIIRENIPEDLDGNKIIDTNFKKPNGPAAMVEQLAQLEDGLAYWFQDESSQMFKFMELEGHPTAENKEHLLNIADYKSLSRIKSGQDPIITKPITMTNFFINTIDGMAKAISEHSFKEGLMRRFGVVYIESDGRDPTDYPLYDLSELESDFIKEKTKEVLSQDIYEKTFTFNNLCLHLYNKAFALFWKKQYERWMTEANFTTYRTYMMLSWKFAVIHHLIHMKEGTVIQEESLEWSLKVVMFLLNSYEKFIRYRATLGKSGTSIKVEENYLNKVFEFIKVNDSKPSFTIREICRKFTIKKDEAVRVILSIKANNPKAKYRIFEKAKNELNKLDKKQLVKEKI